MKLIKIIVHKNRANLRGLIAATGLVILLNMDSNRRFFGLCDLEIWWMTSKKIGHLFYAMSSFVHHLKAIGEFKLELQSGNTQFCSKLATFCPTWSWNLMDDLEKKKGIFSMLLQALCLISMTLRTNRTPLLRYFKLYASFHNHRWIQTRVTVRKHPIWVKIVYFLQCVTLKFDGWPWKIIGHLFYATSSFVHHIIAISEFNLALQSGNTQFGSKSIFLSHVTLKFDGWSWKTIRHLYCKLFVSFCFHLWILSGVTVWKRPNKGNFFLASVTLTFDL